MKAEIIDNKIKFRGKVNPVDDLYTEAFYIESNKESINYNNDSYGVNEVYMNLVQPYLAIEQWLLDNKPGRLYLSKASDNFSFYAKDICRNNHIETLGFHWWLPLYVHIKYAITVLSSALYFLYLLLKIPFKNEIKVSPQFAVLRTKAAIKKFKKFQEIGQEIEDPYNKDSVYRLFPKKLRMKWLMRAYLNSFTSMRQMSDYYCLKLGKHFKYALMNYYSRRILYAELYRLLLDEYFSHFTNSTFYTGNNLDRFSVIEEETCKKYGIKSYCIPHGIEYGFRFPKGFSCDVFYTHSQYTANYLNNLYDTQKYVYDENVIRRMFEYNCDQSHEQMIIFFTESREVNVNKEIIKELLPLLKNDGLQLYIKLHPMDDKNNYEGIDVDYITDYDLSLTGNICISRKSTILIEAIYNRSIPIAIITNPKDQSLFNTFPSLNSPEIIKTYSVDELYGVIKKFGNVK